MPVVPARTRAMRRVSVALGIGVALAGRQDHDQRLSRKGRLPSRQRTIGDVERRANDLCGLFTGFGTHQIATLEEIEGQEATWRR